MDEIKAVVFDWGGVLIDNPAAGLIRHCSSALGVSTEQFAEAHERYIPEFQKGLISEREFWRKICSGLKISTPEGPSLWGEAFRHVYSPKEDMFHLAACLKKNEYKTGLLSNTEAPAVTCFYEHHYQMFDVLVFSCHENTVKPERRIYEVTLGKLGTTPSETVFIDDREDYINGARQVGIQTILFKDPSDTIEKLAAYSIVVTQGLVHRVEG
jgi:putative hydrolase of the HAD superfamily